MFNFRVKLGAFNGLSHEPASKHILQFAGYVSESRMTSPNAKCPVYALSGTIIHDQIDSVVEECCIHKTFCRILHDQIDSVVEDSCIHKTFYRNRERSHFKTNIKDLKGDLAGVHR